MQKNIFLACLECRTVRNLQYDFFHDIPCFTTQLNTKSTSWAWIHWTVPGSHTPGLMDIPPLTHQLTDYILHNTFMVPVIIVNCIEEINRRYLAAEVGIYRICGSKKNVKDLREKLLAVGSRSPNLSQYNIQTLSGVVKHFLISLEEPLITYSMYKVITQAAILGNMVTLLQAISNLPLPNRSTLAFLILHLKKIAEATTLAPSALVRSIVSIVGYSSKNPSNQEIIEASRLQITTLETFIDL